MLSAIFFNCSYRQWVYMKLYSYIHMPTTKFSHFERAPPSSLQENRLGFPVLIHSTVALFPVTFTVLIGITPQKPSSVEILKEAFRAAFLPVERSLTFT